jgi:hypothetical protein
MSGTFSEWSPYTNYVQAGTVDGRYVNAGHILLAAGPPRLANIGGATAFAQAVTSGTSQANQMVMPIGIVQNFNVSHSRQFAQIFEIGSERSYFISGRTVGQLQLGRVFYHGASLLRMLYAYYQDNLGAYTVPALFGDMSSLGPLTPNAHDVVLPAGYENLFINLASDLFTQPIGLMMYVRDINQDTMGAGYFEACVVPQHGWATDAQGVLVQEQCALQFERMVPVNVSNLTVLETMGTNAGDNPGLTV